MTVLDPADGPVTESPPPLPSPPPNSHFLGERYRNVDGLRLAAPSGNDQQATGRQEMVISPVDATTGAALWQKVVPGIVSVLAPSSQGAMIVVIDQTGGTGNANGEAYTRVTAYRSTDGEREWQISLDRTPLPACGANPNTVTIAEGSNLFALNATTGDRR